jgi:hypothetical protein
MNTSMVSYPENKPSESGYYYTKYFNTQLMEYRYKALWYSVKKDKWLWRIVPYVATFCPDSRNDYYVSCEMNYKEARAQNEHLNSGIMTTPV